MCRLLAYKGPSVILDELLYKPEHSLIKQSYKAQEMEEPLNGDGFGIGWYALDIDPNPAVFASIQPAWNNRNLQYMSPKISSACVFAHVRAASVGGVSELNCHPFHCHNFMMMHNGGIEDFQEIRRPLLAKLSDPQFQTIKGQTDSEHIFALFLEHLYKGKDEQCLSNYRDALKATVEDIIKLKDQYGLKESSTLNLFITDGKQIIGCRYISDSSMEPLLLYFAEGGRFECRDSKYTLRKADDKKAVLFVSERLNKEEQEWHEVPANHFFAVDGGGTIEFTEV